MAKILGLSCFYHDSAAALIDNGEIIYACQEERFSRKKHDPSFPFLSINSILSNTKIKISDIDYVTFYDKPLLKFERLLETYLYNIPYGFNSFKKSLPVWIKEKLFLKKLLNKNIQSFDKSFNEDQIFFSEHHFSHAASAFYPSPYKEAVVLTVDGVGEWATTSIAVGHENKLDIKKEIHFPHSLGLLYSAFTYFLGFKVNSGEYKVMGLAPYGKPKYKNLIFDNLIKLNKDGSFKLNQKFFNYMTGLKMINENFENLFNLKTRKANSERLSKKHADIAASIQLVVEEVILLITRKLYDEYKIKNLCIAGGVGLNCVANGKIIEDEKFKNIWVQPASGDAGASIGSALALWHHELKKKRIIIKNDAMKGSLLGPKYDDNEIESFLKRSDAKYTKFSTEKIIEKTVNFLTQKKVIGWFQGKMEFGPRALGSRSIIADPRDHKMQKIINLKIKFRESFRPFAPAVLKEDQNKWFNLKSESRYMLFVGNILNKHRYKRRNVDSFRIIDDKISKIPAVTHVDFTSRIQTVSKNSNILFYRLIKEFKKKTNCPMIINTSFNIRGEPIVCTPEDAFNCFMGTDMDILVIGNFILKKSEQNLNLNKDKYKSEFELD